MDSSGGTSGTTVTYFVNTERGWICPRCGASVSPHYSTCPKCSADTRPCYPTPYPEPIYPWLPVPYYPWYPQITWTITSGTTTTTDTGIRDTS